MITMRQTVTDGGHLLTGECQLADGWAIFEQVWQNVTAEPEDGGPPTVVDSVLVHERVWLNNCIIRDPGMAKRLWQEATRP
jgi:hypothetical protein